MADVKYCGECGTKVKSGAKACHKCGSEPSRATKFCSNCGEAKASPNAIMCVSCGEALTKPSSDKDPSIAALISIVCMFLLGAPGIGYIYLGNVKKGLVYIAASWLFWMAVVIAYVLGTFTLVGAICCLPLLFVPLAFDLLIVYDVYLEAKGEPTKLPSF